MDINTATEQAYRNGYEAGKKDAEPKWIPTAKKMPDDFVSVLVHIPGDEPMPTVKEAYHAGGIWIGRVWKYNDSDVTHWTPLPNPPTE